MKLWLAQRFGRAKPGEAPSEASGPTLSKAMGIDSLEHIVRNRVRMFLRNTWLVAILGTLLIGAGIYSAIYISIAPTEMRIAAGPAGSTDVKFVQLLAGRFASEHDKIRLHLVVTDGPKQSAEALADDKADLAILPSTTGNSLVWPVVAIVRQNVMALIVPTPPPTVPAKKEAAPPPKKEETAGADKGEKAGKGGKEAKDSKKGAVAAKTATKSAKGAKNEKSEKSEKNDKAGKGAKSTKVAKKGDADADKDEDADTSDDASGGKDGKDADTTSTDADDANKLDKITKLAGHRVGIVTGSAATKDLLDAVLNHYGVPLAQVQVSYVDPKNAADAIKAKQVDVLFAVGPSTGHAINDAIAAATQDGRAPTFIAIDQAEGINKRDSAFKSVDIDAGTFGGNPPTPDDSLTSLSFAEYLVARKGFSHDAISALAKLIYSSRLALAAAMPHEIKIEAPSTDKDASVLVHPGALAYLGDDQKTFFDRYGDAIFYGLLVFPIFGSAIAGVASYFTRNRRTRRLRLLQSVLDLVRKAPAAPSLEALDQMHTNVDQLVVAIIHQGEREEYDQSMQMSFSLALDQVRFAIASRRAVLLGQGAADAQSELKPEPVPEATLEPEPEATPEPEFEATPAAELEATPEPEAEPQPEAELDAKTEPELEAKPDTTPDSTPDTGPDASKAAAA